MQVGRAEPAGINSDIRGARLVVLGLISVRSSAWARPTLHDYSRAAEREDRPGD